MSPRVLIGDLNQIPKGKGRLFAAAGREAQAIEVFATEARYPHLQGPLADGLIRGTTIVCPLHDLWTGLGVTANRPALRSIRPCSTRRGKSG
jgi:nitrite reductase (NADH) small subunit